jgi:hypothetical protein
MRNLGIFCSNILSETEDEKEREEVAIHTCLLDDFVLDVADIFRCKCSRKLKSEELQHRQQREQHNRQRLRMSRGFNEMK